MIDMFMFIKKEKTLALGEHCEQRDVINFIFADEEAKQNN